MPSVNKDLTSLGITDAISQHVSRLLSRTKHSDKTSPSENSFSSGEMIDEACISYDEKSNTCLVKPAMSRRSFLGFAATGFLSLVALDVIRPGAVGYAYADEEGNYGLAITVLSRYEVGIIARDVKTQNVLEGVELTVKSYYGSTPTCTGKTNFAGVFVFDARGLSENGNEPDASRYGFWGNLYAKKANYRDYETGKIRYTSGPPLDKKGVQVPMQAYDSKPYARLITYDGFDIQYATSTILITSANDANHTLRMTVHSPQGGTVTAKLIHDGVEVASLSQATQNNLATLDFVGTFNASFKPGAKTLIRMGVGSQQCEIETKLACFTNERLAAPDQGAVKLAPAGSAQAENVASEMDPGAYSFTIPKGIPIVEGTTFNLDMAQFPVYGYFDPFGRGIITTNFSDIDVLKKVDGKWEAGEWKFINKESVEDAQKRREDAYDKALIRVGQANNNAAEKGSKIGASDKFGGLKIKFSFNLMGMGEYKWYDADASNKFTGIVKATATLGMKYDITKQFTLCGFPVYFGFDIGTALSLSVAIGAVIKGFFESISWSSEVGAVIVVRFEIGVTLGIGIAGFLSVSVRGYGYFVSSLALTIPAAGKPFPHISVSAQAGVGWSLQVFFFRASGKIYESNFPALYDNWKSNLADPSNSADGSLSFPDFGALTLPGIPADTDSFGNIYQDLVPLDGDAAGIAALNAIAEFEGDYGNDVNNTRTDETPEGIQQNPDNGWGEGSFTETRPTITGADCSLVGILDPNDENVEDYDISRGIKPATDTKILENIFSDPRQKIVNVNGTLYLLRIAVVTVRSGILSGTSSRITIAPFENGKWGTAKVIDFAYPTLNPTWLSRYWFYDYDFDVATVDGKIHIMLVSGTRKNLGKTAWWEAINKMVASYICYDLSTGKVDPDHSDHYFEAYGKTDDEGNGVMLCHPRVAPLLNYGQSVVSAAVVASGVKEEAAGVSFSRTLAIFWRKGDGSAFVDDIYEYTQSSGAKELCDMQLTYPINYQENKAGAVVVMDLKDPGSTSNARELSLQWFTSEGLGYASGSVQNVGYCKIHPQGGVVAPVLKDGAEKMYRIQYNQPGGNPLVETKLGDWAVKSFALSNDGTWLFSSDIMEGQPEAVDVKEFSGMDDPEVFGDPAPPKREQYRLLAAHMYGRAETMSDLFPIAQLARPIDNLYPVNGSGDYFSILYTHITNLEKSQADMYYASIPYVKSLQIDGASTREDFVGPEDTCHIVVNVRNTGNVGVSSFMGKLFVGANKDLVAELNFESLKAGECLLPSIDTYDEATDSVLFDAADNEGVLLPSRSRLYQTEFTIPKDWHGTKELFVSLTDIREATVVNGFNQFGEENLPGSLVRQIDAAPEKCSIEIDPDTQLEVAVSANDYRYWVIDDPDNPDDPNNRDRLPQTGDDAATFAAIAAAAAASATVIGLGSAFEKTESEEED